MRKLIQSRGFKHIYAHIKILPSRVRRPPLIVISGGFFMFGSDLVAPSNFYCFIFYNSANWFNQLINRKNDEKSTKAMAEKNIKPIFETVYADLAITK